MSRILRTELRRSAAIGTMLVLAALGVALLYLLPEASSATNWMTLAMTQRLLLAVLWPLALAAGAWQGTRERRAKVIELFATTPRPASHRAVPVVLAMAAAVVSGYLLMGVAGGVRILSTAEYLPAQAFTVTAVGALALMAAAWLGLAVGRLLPWIVTPPALAVAGLALLLTIPGATRPHGWLATVFSPIYEMNMPNEFATVPARASAAQAIWLAGLAACGVLLFAFTDWRARVSGLLPLVLGGALAVAVMPHQNRYVGDAADPVAQEQVCAEGEPRVCLSRVHEGFLPEVVAPAREGLALLARLPGPPSQVHEDTTVYAEEMIYPAWQPGTVLLDIDTDHTGRLLNPDRVLADVVSGAFAGPPGCENYTPLADRVAAAHWLIGREPAPEEITTTYDPAPAPYAAEAVELWQRLKGMPPAEAQERIVAMRQASVKCAAEGGLFPESAR